MRAGDSGAAIPEFSVATIVPQQNANRWCGSGGTSARHEMIVWAGKWEGVCSIQNINNLSSSPNDNDLIYSGQNVVNIAHTAPQVSS